MDVRVMLSKPFAMEELRLAVYLSVKDWEDLSGSNNSTRTREAKLSRSSSTVCRFFAAKLRNSATHGAT